MGVKAMTWAWDQAVSPASHLVVLLALADHADDEGCCVLSRKMIAARCRASVDTVDRAIANLVRCGLVEKCSQNDEDGSQAANEYRLNIKSGVAE